MKQARTHTHFDIPDAEKRLKELIVYISWKFQNADEFGAVKLNKVLFYSDFCAFASLGKPITGVEYMRLQNGPVPRKLVPTVKSLEKEQAVYTSEVRHKWDRSKIQKRLTPIRGADMSFFSKQEIAIIDRVIMEFWGKSAKATSGISHGRPWQMVEDNESIPYEFAFLGGDMQGKKHVARLDELIKQHGWT